MHGCHPSLLYSVHRTLPGKVRSAKNCDSKLLGRAVELIWQKLGSAESSRILSAKDIATTQPASPEPSGLDPDSFFWGRHDGRWYNPRLSDFAKYICHLRDFENLTYDAVDLLYLAHNVKPEHDQDRVRYPEGPIGKHL